MNSTPESRPDAGKVSVVVLCRNEQNHIARCLDSLLASDYDPRLVEIIVVDGMSTDGTRQIVAEYCRKYPRIRTVDNPKKIIPAALNVGIREATSEIIMRTDAHALYPPDYIRRVVDGLSRYEADGFGGVLAVDEGRTAWHRAMALLWSHAFRNGDSMHRIPPGDSTPRPTAFVFPGCWRRRVFEKIGLFNEFMVRAEDREFYARLARAGGSVFVDPSLRLTYFPRTGLGTYVRYCAINGFWVFYARRFTRTRLIFWRNLVPLAFVLWHLAAILVGVLLPPLLPFLLAPIAAYWGLNALISVQLAWTHRNAALFPCLFVLFPLTHYPYGLGSLYGWLRATVEGKHASRKDPAPSPPGAEVHGLAPAVRRVPWWDEGAKRALDLFLAAVGLVLIAPLLAAIALAIKLDSPGPVFYRGVRIGRGFKPFRVFKFRTMVANAEQLGGSTASRYDPRITRVGRFLRRTKLDELPNLINVLIGQMSLVGPRPEVKFYTDKYTEEERAILSVRPGITDFASLEFAHQQALIGDEDPERDFQARVLPRKNALRLKYARERSFWVDMRILGATFWLFFSKPFQWIGQRFRRKR
jgi:lipopolysaccharide/colanic/teichoic acid biosynthesis glycosyltransferase/glycosyltransferase involved in cell wall biosynthesis